MSRRIAVVGAGATRTTEASLARAARALGHAAVLVDVPRTSRLLGRLAGPLIERRIERFAPDLLIVTRHALGLGEERLARLFARRDAAFWYLDLTRRPEAVTLGRLAGTLYHTCQGELDHYRAAGVPVVRHLPQAADRLLDRPGAFQRRRAADVSFIGSGQYPHRWPVLLAVARACRLRIRGPGWAGAPDALPVAGGPVHGQAFRDEVASSAVSLGANALAGQAGTAGATSNRLWKVLGSGGYFLGEWGPGLDDLARDGEHCGWYRGVDDAVDRVRWALAHPDEAGQVAARGRAYVEAHHRYEHRLAAMLGM